MDNSWDKKSWRKFPVKQQPVWPDQESYSQIIRKLNTLPSLVFSGETRILKERLKTVNSGESFILQAGNCAESFSDCTGPAIHNFLRIFLQMSNIIETISGKKVIKIGRIAGQYSKPRSSDFEIVNGQSLPCYKGDNINEVEPTIEARTPDPKKLLEGYYNSVATLNLIRAFTQGGYSDITFISDWEEHLFSEQVSVSDEYKKFRTEISSLLKFDKESKKISESDVFFISHEALLLDYEEAFTRLDTIKGGMYDTSAHTIWLGDRTRQLDSGHVEYVRGINNPIGIKIGPDYSPDEIISILDKINPENEEGKIMLIIRMGKNNPRKIVPLIEKIKELNKNVIWMCDPMHGNTFSHNGYKVRSFDDIFNEIFSFMELCNELDVTAGGVHLEITSDFVTECIGGINGLKLENVQENYITKVDPRLNAAQAIELSLKISKLLNSKVQDHAK